MALRKEEKKELKAGLKQLRGSPRLSKGPESITRAMELVEQMERPQKRALLHSLFSDMHEDHAEGFRKIDESLDSEELARRLSHPDNADYLHDLLHSEHIADALTDAAKGFVTTRPDAMLSRVLKGRKGLMRAWPIRKFRGLSKAKPKQELVEAVLSAMEDKHFAPENYEEPAEERPASTPAPAGRGPRRTPPSRPSAPARASPQDPEAVLDMIGRELEPRQVGLYPILLESAQRYHRPTIEDAGRARLDPTHFEGATQRLMEDAREFVKHMSEQGVDVHEAGKLFVESSMRATDFADFRDKLSEVVRQGGRMSDANEVLQHAFGAQGHSLVDLGGKNVELSLRNYDKLYYQGTGSADRRNLTPLQRSAAAFFLVGQMAQANDPRRGRAALLDFVHHGHTVRVNAVQGAAELTVHPDRANPARVAAFVAELARERRGQQGRRRS